MSTLVRPTVLSQSTHLKLSTNHTSLQSYMLTNLPAAMNASCQHVRIFLP